MQISSMDFIQANDSVFIYFVIPVISALVGWLTNILALKMTFYPIEFMGIPPYLGWQGIIPSKVKDMAAKSVDMLTGKLISVEEVFAQMDPKVVAEEMQPVIDDLSRSITDDVMEEQMPMVWNTIPDLIKNQVFRQVAQDLPQVVEEMMEDMKAHITELFDLKTMVINEMVNNKKLTVEIFLRCGKEEFKFIERSGFYFGFLFGVIQMFIWHFFPFWWILPLGGLLIGYLTNQLALKLIFEPKQAKTFGPWTVQGLFQKRQQEVSAEYAKIVTKKILTVQNIFESILRGPASDQLIDMTQKHIRESVDKITGFSKTFIQLSQGTQKYERIKDIACDRFVAELPKSITAIFDYAEEALDIENTLRTKMSELPPEEFEGLLRPVFQEDEWKLILTGAILGAIAGFLQLIFLT